MHQFHHGSIWNTDAFSANGKDEGLYTNLLLRATFSEHVPISDVVDLDIMGKFSIMGIPRRVIPISGAITRNST